MTTREPGIHAPLRGCFLAHAGRIVESQELEEAVSRSDITSWIKELRYEEGLTVLTHRERPDPELGQYVYIWRPGNSVR